MSTVWETPPAAFAIEVGAVHVWRAILNAPDWDTETFARLLNAEERARAARFRFEQDRNRFTAGRGLLRTLLSFYGRFDAASLEFTYSKHGKPSLASGDLHFNVSHSGHIVLVAIAANAGVGVDVECVDRQGEHEKLAERFFSADEVERLRALPERDRGMAFFECWTRKEAFIKAHGHGLTLPLDSFSVAFGPGTPARLTRFDGNPATEHWTMSAPDVAEGYAGAVCLAASSGRFRHFDASPLGARF